MQPRPPRPRSRKSRVGALVLVLALASLRLARVGRADEGSPDPAVTEAARAEARDHFQKGSALQNQHEYAQAIVEYQRAYALVPLAGLLFNIAQCYRLSGDAVNAVAYYRRYIDADSNGRGVDEARKHIDELTRPRVDASKNGKPQEPVEPAPPAAVVPPTTAPSVPATPLPAATPATKVVRGIRSLRISGLATAGAGIVALGVGTWFAIETQRLENDIERTPRWGADYNQKIVDGNRAETRMIVGFVVGGALVAGGATLYWFGRDHHEKVTVAPLVGAVTGVGVLGRF